VLLIEDLHVLAVRGGDPVGHTVGFIRSHKHLLEQ
jgi:hypothetical protein